MKRLNKRYKRELQFWITKLADTLKKISGWWHPSIIKNQGLLIEAGQCYPNLKQLIGFDNDKKHISLAMQNIKNAGLVKKCTTQRKRYLWQARSWQVRCNTEKSFGIIFGKFKSESSSAQCTDEPSQCADCNCVDCTDDDD